MPIYNILNPSFELPALAGASTSNHPVNTYWTFTGGTFAGIGSNGNAYSFPNADSGTQYAMLQNAGATLSQTITGFTIGNGYQISFKAVGRPGYGSNTFNVTLDSVRLATDVNPNTTSAWVTFVYPFTATNTSHTFQISGTDALGGDKTTAFDTFYLYSGSSFSVNADHIAKPAVIGVLRGISVGGLTSIIGDSSNGIYFQIGVTRNNSLGTPTAPCLTLTQPGMWRFRWAVPTGTHTISIAVQQAVSDTAMRPSLIVKANPSIGINSDVTGTAPAGTGWVTIGPVTVTATANGVVWVELWNNYRSLLVSASFDNIQIT